MFLAKNFKISLKSKTYMPTILLLLIFFPLITATRAAPVTSTAAVYTVHGTVVDINGRLLDGVTVTVYDASGSLVTQTQTFTGGFVVSLSSGTYRVQFNKAGYESKTLAVSVSTSSVNLGTITLGYSLKLSASITYLTTNCLSEVSIPISISNVGSQNEFVNLSTNTPSGWKASIYLGQTVVNQLKLSSGSTQSLTLVVDVPYNASGLYNLTVIASGLSVQNETISFNVKKVEPQILISKYPITKSLPGSSVSFDFTIVNTFNKRFTGLVSPILPNGWTGNVVKSDGSVLYGVSLGPGESVSGNLNLYIPSDISPGSYEVKLLLKAQLQELGYFETSLTLTVLVKEGEPIIRLSTTTPYLDSYAGSSVSFPISVKNIGDSDGVVSINITGLPSGYTWLIKDSSGNVLSKLYLKAGESKNLNIVVSIPPLAEPNIIPFTLKAYTGNSYDQANFSLGVLGWYKLSYVTQDFYVETTAGSTTTFQVSVRNSGYSSLSNIRLQVSDVPSGFTVNVDPSVVLLLKPQDSATFTISITTNSDISAGDYYITLNLVSDQSQVPTRSLHVYVKQSAGVVYVGVALIVVLAGVLVVFYRKYGRR